MFRFWNNEIEPEDKLKEVKDIVDSNGYPRITDPYKKLWDYDEFTIVEYTKKSYFYIKYLAETEFTIFDASSLLLFDIINSGELRDKIFDKEEDSQIYEN